MWSIEQMRRSIAVACVCVAIPVADTAAQSTANLMTARTYGRFEAALGRELVGDKYSGSVTGAYGAYRAVLENNSAWRVMGWALWRSREGVDSNGQPVEVEHRALVAAVGPELRLPVARQSWFVGFLGAGYARLYASRPEYDFEAFQKSANGWALVGGLGLTVRRLTLQQHIVIIHGAHQTLQVNREYYPIMVGVRF
jgi:hypothetical protein